MRFTALAVINTISLIVAGVVAILAAMAGLGYWALVAMAIVTPLTTSIGSWIVSGWIPGKPRREHRNPFDGALWRHPYDEQPRRLRREQSRQGTGGALLGVDALGIYGRAYQLVNIPIDNLNSAAGEVAFSALSRIQDDAERLKRYFLKGYSLLLAMTIPITIACALFASDLIAVVLGPKWTEAVPIFRWLAPTDPGVCHRESAGLAHLLEGHGRAGDSRWPSPSRRS